MISDKEIGQNPKILLIIFHHKVYLGLDKYFINKVFYGLDKYFINKVFYADNDEPYSRKQKKKWRAYSYQHDIYRQKCRPRFGNRADSCI